MGKDADRYPARFGPVLARIAEELGQEVYPDGLPRGTKFSDLEELAGTLGDEIARRLIEQQVQQQAEDWPEEELGECPLCGGAARKAPGEPRVLKTTRGDVTWKERVRKCRSCRRAFFPSEPSIGIGSHRP